jgi:hypothetical protein
LAIAKSGGVPKIKSAKGRTRTALFVSVLCGPFRAQISSRFLVGVGRCLYLFVLVVALVVALDSYYAEGEYLAKFPRPWKGFFCPSWVMVSA